MDKKKWMAAAGAVLIGAAGLGAGFALDNPAPTVQYKDKIVTVEVPVEKIVEVEKEVPVEVIREVEVDNGDLEIVLNYLEDKDIFDDAEKIVDDIRKEDEALLLAVSEIEKEFADELEDAELVDDEDDVSIIKIYDGLDDVEILSADYDDEEFLFKIKVKLDDDETDEKFRAYFEVEVEDGEAKIIDVYLEE